MRGHAKFEHLQMAFKGGRINGPGQKSCFQVLPAVQALAPGSNLNSLEQQIETACSALRTTWSSVKRACGERESEYEQSRESALPFCKLAKLALPFGVQIVDQVSSPIVTAEHLETRAKLPAGRFQH